MRSGMNPDKREVLLMLRRLWPHRNVNVVHVLANGTVQHSSDSEFKSAVSILSPLFCCREGEMESELES